MSDEWFNEYVYEIAINKNLLNQSEAELLNEDFNKYIDYVVAADMYVFIESFMFLYITSKTRMIQKLIK